MSFQVCELTNATTLFLFQCIHFYKKSFHFLIIEVARPANEADKKSLPSLIFLSFGIFLLHSVNGVIRDRTQRRIDVRRTRNRYQRRGRSYSEDALESLFDENSEFMESLLSKFDSTNEHVSISNNSYIFSIF